MMMSFKQRKTKFPSINGLVLYLCCALKSHVLQPLYRALPPEVDQRRGLHC